VVGEEGLQMKKNLLKLKVERLGVELRLKMKEEGVAVEAVREKGLQMKKNLLEQEAVGPLMRELDEGEWK
jgi:hypothetical protein